VWLLQKCLRPDQTATRRDTEHCTKGFIWASTKEHAILHFLKKKLKKDGEKWKPDLMAVRATIKYVIATKRLEKQ
jgi:hypothetical protein